MAQGEQARAMAGGEQGNQPPQRGGPQPQGQVQPGPVQPAVQADAQAPTQQAQAPAQIPDTLTQAIDTLRSRRTTLTVNDINQFVEALINSRTVLSDSQLQALADRVSADLGVDTIDLSNWRMRDLVPANTIDAIDMNAHIPRDLTVAEAAAATVAFARRVRTETANEMPDATRVYLWRDGFPVMAADNEMATANRAAGRTESGRTAGILISRGTVENPGTPSNRPVVYPTMQNLIRQAHSFAVNANISPEIAFRQKLRELVVNTRQTNQEFDTACNRIVRSLIHHGAIRTENGQVVPQSVMFVDTGFRTFPAMLSAIVETTYPNVRTGTFYHTVAQGYESVLPHINVQHFTDNSIYVHEALGATASFIEGGTMNDNGVINVTPNNNEGIRDSILYQLLLNNMIMREESGG
jgi:hypothetical protein